VLLCLSLDVPAVFLIGSQFQGGLSDSDVGCFVGCGRLASQVLGDRLKLVLLVFLTPVSGHAAVCGDLVPAYFLDAQRPVRDGVYLRGDARFLLTYLHLL